MNNVFTVKLSYLYPKIDEQMIGRNIIEGVVSTLMLKSILNGFN